jgi:hypothetical protein
MMSSEHDNNDVTLTCCDCGNDFTWSDGEQRFYTERNLSMPRRCQPCRTYRRQEREQASESANPQRGAGRASWGR